MVKSSEQFHRKHRNFFVGLFILIPLVLLPAFLLYTLIKMSYLEKTSYLFVKYDNAAGLGKNAAVTVLGIKVGYVESVRLNGAGYIDVTMKVKRDCMRLVKKDGLARLQQKNVAIGDWEIELTGGSRFRARRKAATRWRARSWRRSQRPSSKSVKPSIRFKKYCRTSSTARVRWEGS